MFSQPGDIGASLIHMLDGCQHRGPDSTGFALYREPYSDRLVSWIHLGEPQSSPGAEASAKKVFAIIEAYGGKLLDSRFKREQLRVELAFDGDVKPLCYAIEEEASVK